MKKFLSLGLVRGIIWQVSGTGLGVGFVVLMRVLMHLPAWKAEPAVVFGALLGAIFFLIGVGAFTDWFRMAMGEEVEELPDESGMGWRRYLGVSLDHKVIGIQYMVLAMILMSVGGIFALIFRSELVNTGMQFLTLIEYNTLMSLHGMVMIVSILVGIAHCTAFDRRKRYGVSTPECFFILDRSTCRVDPFIKHVPGGVRYGLDRIPSIICESPIRNADVLSGGCTGRFYIHPGIHKYYCNRHPSARQRYDPIPDADLHLGCDRDIHHQPDGNPTDWALL
jgi:hypothetical protein